MDNNVRLIDANALDALEDLKYNYNPVCDGDAWYRATDVWECLDNQPTIEPETLRPTGRWEECDWVDYDGHGECIHYPWAAFVCTNCRNAFKKEFVHNPRVEYCPHCGAKMEGQ